MTTCFGCEEPRYPVGTLVNEHSTKSMRLIVHQGRDSRKLVILTDKETMMDREAKAADDQYSVS